MTEKTISKEESEALRKQGADDFAKHGLNARNPLYRTENKPTITGEDTEVWEAKVKAWEAGYEAEKLKRKK